MKESTATLIPATKTVRIHTVELDNGSPLPLKVVKQIPEHPVVNLDGRRMGDVWGWMDVWLAKTPKSPDTLHVLHVIEDTFYRGILSKDLPRQIQNFFSDAIYRLSANAVMLMRLCAEPIEVEIKDGTFYIKHASFKVPMKIVRRYLPTAWPEIDEEDLRREVLDRYTDGAPEWSTLIDERAELVVRYTKAVDEYQLTYETIKLLPQIYIVQ